MSDDLREELRSALESAKTNAQDQAEVNEQVQEEIKEDKIDVSSEEKPAVKERDESGKFKAKEARAQDQAIEAVKEAIQAPDGWTAAVKQQWANLPREVQAEIARREKDVHKMMTSPDGELNFGRRMKETISPYLAVIQSEGGEPVAAVRDLLNTAYVLRTADPVKKAQLMDQVIRQYGVDMSLVNRQQQAQQYDPVSAMMQEIQSLKQAVNPDIIRKQLQEQMENDKVLNEVNAFASDPANKHYEAVKHIMASLISAGTASNLKEAYDSACYAVPDIRSMLMAEQTAKEQAKRNDDLNAKKRAAASITGSPSVSVPNSGSPDRTLREELKANLRSLSSS